MSTKNMTPSKDYQRSNLLDALRGFALIGFFLASMTFYSGYGYMSTAQKSALRNWWLNKFEYGPLEWLWRCFTYGQWLPIKKNARVAVA